MLVAFAEMSAAKSRRLLEKWLATNDAALRAVRLWRADEVDYEQLMSCANLLPLAKAAAAAGRPQQRGPGNARGVPFLSESFGYSSHAATTLDMLVSWYAALLLETVPGAEPDVAASHDEVGVNEWVVRANDGRAWPIFTSYELWRLLKVDGRVQAAQELAERICLALPAAPAAVGTGTRRPTTGHTRQPPLDDDFRLVEESSDRLAELRLAIVPGWHRGTAVPDGVDMGSVRVIRQEDHVQLIVEEQRPALQPANADRDVFSSALLRDPAVLRASQVDADIYELELSERLSRSQLADLVLDAAKRANAELLLSTEPPRDRLGAWLRRRH